MITQDELKRLFHYNPETGLFTQGQGYRHYGDSRDKEYLCGNREIRGCPIKPELKVS